MSFSIRVRRNRLVVNTTANQDPNVAPPAPPPEPEPAPLAVYQPPSTPAPASAAPLLQIVAHSSKHFALAGNTYPYRDRIKAAGGYWLKREKLWIFLKGLETEVRRALHDLLTPGVAPSTPALPPGPRYTTYHNARRPGPTPQELAERFRAKADSLQKTIDYKRNPAIAQQRYTRRRESIAQGMRTDADHLERLQGCLRGLATAWENESVPPLLEKLRGNRQVEAILNGWPQDVLDHVGLGDKGERERAKTLLLALSEKRTVPPASAAEQKVRDLERGLRASPPPGFFPTPPDIVRVMLHHAQLRPGMRVLEPSAGKGDIVEGLCGWTRQNAGCSLHVSCVENNLTLAEILRLKGFEAINDDFLLLPLPRDTHQGGGYDRVLMNPPFEDGQDVLHVRRAYAWLKPGGRLVAIMSEGPFFRRNRRDDEFRDWLAKCAAYTEQLPDGCFDGKDAFVPTGVKCRQVVVDKPA